LEKVGKYNLLNVFVDGVCCGRRQSMSGGLNEKTLYVARCLCAAPDRFAHAATLTSVTIGQTVQKDDTLFVFFHAADEQGHAVNGLTGDGIFWQSGRRRKKFKSLPLPTQVLASAMFSPWISRSLSAKSSLLPSGAPSKPGSTIWGKTIRLPS
jgi:hypothetical protein